MWDMFLNSLKLFFRGKLFREPKQVLRQWLIGLLVALMTLVILVKLGLATWLAVLLVSVAVGALQPWLFKDLKYA